MKKSNGIVLGVIGLGLLFVLSSKPKPVFAETTIPNVHEPIPLQIQPISTNYTTDMSTFGASTLITILD